MLEWRKDEGTFPREKIIDVSHTLTAQTEQTRGMRKSY